MDLINSNEDRNSFNKPHLKCVWHPDHEIAYSNRNDLEIEMTQTKYARHSSAMHVHSSI